MIQLLLMLKQMEELKTYILKDDIKHMNNE